MSKALETIKPYLTKVNPYGLPENLASPHFIANEETILILIKKFMEAAFDEGAKTSGESHKFTNLNREREEYIKNFFDI